MTSFPPNEQRFPRRWAAGFFLVVLMSLGSAPQAPPAFAQSRGIVHAEPQDPPSRSQVQEQLFTAYIWWMMQWSDNAFLCEVVADHAGAPTPGEIQSSCDALNVWIWQETTICEPAASGGDTVDCEGAYLHFIGTETRKREIEIILPKPQISVWLEGCQALEVGHRCLGVPTLVVHAVEPLPGESIHWLHVQIDGDERGCAEDTCHVPLAAAYPQGRHVELWVDSSFGDESEHSYALLRTILLDQGSTEEDDFWHVDVISSQWVGEPLAACSLSWDSFPPHEGLPVWLRTPTDASQLHSDQPLDLLSGRLLRAGVVLALDCPGGGLQVDGSANACGVEQASLAVEQWQNRFDARILQSAQTYGVPAQILKNLFMVESQFWPGRFEDVEEYGLGALHERGADTLLLWNASFYRQFCPQVLSPWACQYRFADLNDDAQAMLRGALMRVVNGECPACDEGIDWFTAEGSVDLFAQMLRANCDQVARTVYNITDLPAGSLAGYEDLWRMVLVNYNAGPGCFATALSDTWNGDTPLSWAGYEHSLLGREACDGAVRYVEQVTGE